MKFLPAFQFPTTAVIIDDDLNFIDALKSGLEDKKFFTKTFNNPIHGLEFLKKNNSNQYWHENWVKILPSEYEFESVSIDINFSKICKILQSPKRFNCVTTIIIDYQMPTLNGIKLLELIKDLHIKKILLTGIANSKIAIQALNDGLIDTYIKKSEKDLLTKIKRLIYDNQTNFFHEQSNFINSALKILNERDSYLKTFYYNLIDKIKHEYEILEHCLIDNNGSCIFINKNKEKIQLTIKLEEELEHNSDFQEFYKGSNFYYNITKITY